MLNNLFSFFIKDAYCYQQVIVDQAYGSVSLILYSHIPTAIIALIVGIFLLTKNKKLETWIFFFLSLTFFLFTFGDFIEWFMFVGRGPVMFARSIIELLDPVLFILSSYFLFVLVKKRDIRLIYKIIWLLPLVPLIFRVFLNLNLIGYNWQICEVVESSFSASYIYYIDLFYMISAIIFAVWSIIKGKGDRKEITIASIGVCIFIIVFFVMEYVFTGYILGGVFDYNYFLYAFFGMPILIGFLGYLIVKYNEFNIKLIATQVLVWALVILIGAEFAFIQTNINRILTAITLIISAWLGLTIIRSVKKEIEAKENERLQKEREKLQHEKFEELANRFENVNHILAHDVKNVIGKNRDMFVETLAGTFGEITEQGKTFFKRLTIDTGDLITSVANILKSGDKIIPNPQPFDFKEAVLDAIASSKDKANEEKIKIETQIDESQSYTVNADRSLMVPHVLKNLIENAVNFGVKDGSIWISLSKKDSKTISFIVKDNGWGMTEDDKRRLFKQGGHGVDSIKKNVHTTGFGLFIAKQTMDAHNGKIYATSDGRDKGSTFFVELPVDFTPVVSEAPKI